MPQRWIRLIALAALACGHVQAEEVARRWRIGLDVGGVSPQTEIESDAANVLSFFTPEGEIQFVYIDPRPDAARFGTLAIQPGAFIRISGQYAVSRTVVFEASAGYSRTDVGDVEMHAEFALPTHLDDIGFAFQTFRIPVGEAQIVPLRLSALVRFRPHAPFNPYVGGGIGYQFMGLELTDEFNALSLNLDNSEGVQSYMVPGDPLANPNPNIFVQFPLSPRALDGATVDLPDSFTWHVLAGAELALSPRWALVFDVRYEMSAREAHIGFDGGEDLGVAVPDDSDFVGSPRQSVAYGPVLITRGGLADGGTAYPGPTAPPGTNCVTTPALCLFNSGSRDGIVDPGFYYLNGGTLDYQSFQFAVGVRHTF